MREGWKQTSLGEVVTIASGQVDPKEDAFADLLSVGPDNLFSGGGLAQSSLKTARELGQISGKYAFDAEAILYSKIRPNLNKAALPDFEGICSADMYPMWISDTHKFDRNFVYYTLTSERFVADATSLSFGTGFPRINRQDLETIKFALPPRPEQRKIAAILRTWDEALEKLNALRALNIRSRVWLRTHLFTGKVRLPGFTGEWRKVPLSDVLHEHGSKSIGAEEVYSVSVHKGLVNQVEHLGRSFSAASTDHYNRVLPGDVVYTKSPTGDFPLGIIKQSKIARGVIVSPLYGVFTPQSYALGAILDALFESPLATRNYLNPLVQKGAKNTIAVTNKQFLEGKLNLPMDPDEQAAIADVVNASHAELACLDAAIKALTDQKCGLMQKLLTGEWRIEVTDDEETAA